MAVGDRPYTFRAPAELADRMRSAGAVLDELAATAGPEIAERIARQLVLALVRDGSKFHEARENQSAFMRETIELLLSAVETISDDLKYADAYGEVAADRTDDEVQVRRSARAKAAQRTKKA